MIVPGVLFEEFGFNYIGPVDGHHLPTLLTTIRNISQLEGPQFLHIITRKGKGYGPAEADPVKWHAVSKTLRSGDGQSINSETGAACQADLQPGVQ